MHKLACVLLIFLFAGPLAYAMDQRAGKDNVACQAGDLASGGQWFSETQSIMGTEVTVELWSTDPDKSCKAIAAVMSEIRRIDRAMSSYIDTSLITEMNNHAASRPVSVGRELFDLIATSIKFSELTRGAFDITYASAGRYYNYREGQRPDSETLARAIENIDYRYLELHEEDYSIKYHHQGVYVDLGGIGKGYAVDQGIKILKSLGFDQAMVGAGGDSRILGDRLGEPWVVGIRDPRRQGKMVAVLPLMDVSVSTSGDYERYFEADGMRYHHILDPQTGDSAREVTSVTILGDEATTTDALSTSVFVLGIEKGLKLINKMQGFDAIIIDGKGKMHVSNSLLEMTSSDVNS